MAGAMSLNPSRSQEAILSRGLCGHRGAALLTARASRKRARGGPSACPAARWASPARGRAEARTSPSYVHIDTLRGQKGPQTQAGPPPVKDGAHACAVGAVPVDVQPGGQEDPVLHGDGPVGEGGDEQLIPAWGEEGAWSHGGPPDGLPLSPPQAACTVAECPTGGSGDSASQGCGTETLLSTNVEDMPLPSVVQTRAVKALRSPAQNIFFGSV